MTPKLRGYKSYGAFSKNSKVTRFQKLQGYECYNTFKKFLEKNIVTATKLRSYKVTAETSVKSIHVSCHYCHVKRWFARVLVLVLAVRGQVLLTTVFQTEPLGGFQGYYFKRGGTEQGPWLVECLSMKLTIFSIEIYSIISLKLPKNERRLWGQVACRGSRVDTKHRSSATAPSYSRQAGGQAGGTKIAQQRRETDWGSELVPADTTSCIAQIDPAGESMSWWNTALGLFHQRAAER